MKKEKKEKKETTRRLVKKKMQAIPAFATSAGASNYIKEAMNATKKGRSDEDDDEQGPPVLQCLSQGVPPRLP